MPAATRKVIGLTGGIASGKTVATDALRAAGFAVVDADEVSRALTARGTPAEKALCALFPQAQINGMLDRRALRRIIAEDAAARKKLNAYTHPRILEECRRRTENIGGSVVLSAPLMFETGLNVLCDITVCVTCPLPTRIARLTARDGITEAEAEAIISAQATDKERELRSDYVISSDTDMECFKKTVVTLFEKIM